MLKRSPLRRSDPTARASVPVYRPKQCKACKCLFVPAKRLQLVCDGVCAVHYGRMQEIKKREKAALADRRETRAKLEKLKTRSDYMKEAQREFNRYIRLRDRGMPCICCGEPLGVGEVGGAYDCGHYRSVGSAPHLRFNEDNAHAQRKRCNRYGSGRAVDYRVGLVGRLGSDRVAALEADQAPKHYTIDDLKAIKAKYHALTKALTAA